MLYIVKMTALRHNNFIMILQCSECLLESPSSDKKDKDITVILAYHLSIWDEDRFDPVIHTYKIAIFIKQN